MAHVSTADTFESVWKVRMGALQRVETGYDHRIIAARVAAYSLLSTGSNARAARVWLQGARSAGAWIMRRNKRNKNGHSMYVPACQGQC